MLTAASLMIGAPAAADAVARARRMPALGVGLHVVLVRGRPVLPAERVPDLVGADGNFRQDLVTAGFAFFFRPTVRRQLEAEIRAQFEAFRATGLALDHVNCHNHMQLHPTVLALLLEVGRDYGMRAMRLPCEPFLPSWRAARDGLAGRLAHALALRPWVAVMKARLVRAGVGGNDYLFGMYDSGRMTAARVRSLLAALPDGVSELHFHPAAGDWRGDDPAASGYRFGGEFAALTDPDVAAAFVQAGIERIAFRDVAPRPRANVTTTERGAVSRRHAAPKA